MPSVLLTVNEFILREQTRLEGLRLEIVETERFIQRPLVLSLSAWWLLLQGDLALEDMDEDYCDD